MLTNLVVGWLLGCLVGWGVFAIFPLLVVYVGILPLEGPLKPADMDFSKFCLHGILAKMFG